MDEKSRIYVPPGWTNVQYIKDPKSKVLAIGYDSKGREQRIYSKKWIEKTTAEKFSRLKDVEHRYKYFKAKINKFTLSDSMDKNTVMAYMCLIMELLNIRIGNEVYLAENGSYGLTTLTKKNFKIKNGEHTLEFVGKKGIKHIKLISDKKIINFLNNLIISNKSNYLFCYKTETDKFKNITSGDINLFIKTHLGEDFTAKDIRTYSANKILSNKLKKMKYSNETERKKNIIKAIKETSEELGNTPGVCKSHYIDPERIKNY